MDKINSVNGKSDITNLYNQPTNTSGPGLVFRLEKKDDIGIEKTGPCDSTDINTGKGIREQAQLKDAYQKSLSSYEKREIGIANFAGCMKRYCTVDAQEARQNIVEHLFSSDNELKALTASVFSRLDPQKDHLTPFDEAAREKSLSSARDALKKTPKIKTEAVHWYETVGNLGEKEDLPLLLESYKELKFTNTENSPYAQSSLLNSTERLVSRNPDSVTHENAGEISNALIEGMNSKYSGPRKSAVSLAMTLSDNRAFTGEFPKAISRIPLNDRTAVSLGHFAENLRSNKPERVTFTSLVLDKTMKNSPREFKRTLLNEASKNFRKYPPGSDLSATRDASSVLGKHFETLLGSQQKDIFKRMDPGEQLNFITKYFVS